jgi:hypothetical protein
MQVRDKYWRFNRKFDSTVLFHFLVFANCEFALLLLSEELDLHRFPSKRKWSPALLPSEYRIHKKLELKNR